MSFLSLCTFPYLLWYYYRINKRLFLIKQTEKLRSIDHLCKNSEKSDDFLSGSFLFPLLSSAQNADTDFIFRFFFEQLFKLLNFCE